MPDETEISKWDFVDAETPVGIVAVLPAGSSRTLDFFAAEKRHAYTHCIARDLPERHFAVSYGRIENRWPLELTREAALALAAHIRAASVGPADLIVSHN